MSAWTPTDAQVEQAARALFEKAARAMIVPSEWKYLRPAMREWYMSDARAALVAVVPAILAADREQHLSRADLELVVRLEERERIASAIEPYLRAILWAEFPGAVTNQIDRAEAALMRVARGEQ